MGLLDTAVISFVVIVLLHLTLKNMLASYPGEKDSDGAGESHSIRATGMHPARDEMLDFVRGHLMDLERNRHKKPKGSNYYNDFHDSDLHHERTDLSKFFEVEQSVPDTKTLLREISGGDCGPDSLQDCKDLAPSLTDPQSGNPMRFDLGSDGSATFMTDVWSYQNEKPMNGGKVDGIRGIDPMGSDFTVYPAPDGVRESKFLNSYPYIQSAGQW
jgi:hypothetical protein